MVNKFYENEDDEIEDHFTKALSTEKPSRGKISGYFFDFEFSTKF